MSTCQRLSHRVASSTASLAFRGGIFSKSATKSFSKPVSGRWPSSPTQCFNHTGVTHYDCRRWFHATPNAFASEKPPNEKSANASTPCESPKVEELFQKIIWLDMIEVHLLAELINEKMGLKITDEQRKRMMEGGGSSSSGSEKRKDEEAKEQEKTVFDLKLMGFDTKAKIKVIKEIRAITSLGLKEAKELVEGAPSTVKKQIKKEEAEELKKKLEDVGAQIEIQ